MSYGCLQCSGDQHKTGIRLVGLFETKGLPRYPGLSHSLGTSQPPLSPALDYLSLVGQPHEIIWQACRRVVALLEYVHLPFLVGLSIPLQFRAYVGHMLHKVAC